MTSDSQDSPQPKLGGSLNSGEAITFPHIVYSAPPRGSGIRMTFCSGLEVPQLCKTITSCANLWLGWSLNRSCSPCQELSNNMLHATCTQGNRVYFWLPMVGSQIASLTPDLSFGPNLCCRCPNGSCKPIFDI